MTHTQNNHNPWRGRWPQLAGIGILIAAIIVLLWPGALLALGLGALLVACLILLILTAIVIALLLVRRERS